MKKCQKCGAPLEGFLYNTIGKLLGIKPSEKNPEICNKCEAEKPAEPVKPEQPVAAASPETPEVKAESSSALASAKTGEASEDKEKDDLIS